MTLPYQKILARRADKSRLSIVNMKCRNCGQDNENKRKYCKRCGKPLGFICTACGFENTESDVFCGGCGGDLRKGTDAPEDVKKKGGMPKIDVAKILHIFKRKETEQPKDDKKSEQSGKEPKEKQEEKTQHKMKISQEEVQLLFEEKEKEKKAQEQKNAKADTKLEKKERKPVSRYVDKNTPSVLDAPITQDELDKIFKDYKRKHAH